MLQRGQVYRFLPRPQEHHCPREGATQSTALLREVGSSTQTACLFRDALGAGHQRCYKEKEQLQQRHAAVSLSLTLTLLTSWGREVGSGVSGSVQEVSFSPWKLFCAALPVVQVCLN